MSSEIRVGGVSFTNYRATVIPAISGLLHWTFYGSMGSSGGVNLAPGGPANTQLGSLTVEGTNYITQGAKGSYPTWSTPTLSGGAVVAPSLLTGGSNYYKAQRMTYAGGGGSGASSIVTISGGAVTGIGSHTGGSDYVSAPTPNSVPGNTDCIDTGINRADLTATGWTMAGVFRCPTSGSPSTLFGDAYDSTATGFPMFVTMQTAGGLRAQMFTSPDITIALPSSVANWRFIALTVGGTGNKTLNLYSPGDSLSDTYTYGGGSSVGTTNLKATFGSVPTAASNAGTTDMAFSMLTTGVKLESEINTIYAAVKGFLASRSITVL